MARLLLLGALLAVLASACSTGPSSDGGGVESIDGIGILESFTVDGVETVVEPGVSTSGIPWLDAGEVL